MTRRVALLLAAAASLAACSAEEAAVDFPRIGIDATQAAEVDRAVTILRATCPGISTYRNGYRPVSVRRVDASVTDRREVGWALVTEFEVTVNPSVQGDLATFRAGGNTCLYAVGDGTPIGVSTAKRACLSLCTGSTAEKPYGFIPTPPGLNAGAP